MKKGILFLMLAISVCAQGQSLKETLYSGRLKSEPGTVIRKGDDLTTKTDTTRTAISADTAKAIAQAKEAEAKKYTAPMDLNTMTRNNASASSNKANSTSNSNTAPAATSSGEPATAATGIPAATATPKDNNAAWKEYMNSVVASLQAEALSSKKVKKGIYYASVSYTIETDGQVTVTDVLLTPENDGLKKQIKDRIVVDAPRLNPVLNSSGTPRKVSRKYNFTLTKE